jgi:hypothetical protein
MSRVATGISRKTEKSSGGRNGRELPNIIGQKKGARTNSQMAQRVLRTIGLWSEKGFRNQ